MTNSVTIRTSAPGAKQAASDIGMLKKNIQGVGSKTGGPLGSMLGGFGGISPLAIAAGAGIGIFTAKLGEGFKGMLDEEKQLGRLDQALENNVKNWDGNHDAIDKVVSIGQGLAFTDDDIRESLIKLVPVTKDQTQALKDVQLAMDIARGRNIDLEAATGIVTKAELGQYGALKKLGIEIDANATSTEALALLQMQYNDQAEEYASSRAGQMEAANIKLDEGFESLAGTVTDAGAAIAEFGAQGPAALDLVLDAMTGRNVQKAADAYAAKIQDAMNDLSNVFAAAGAKAGKTVAYSSGTGFNDTIKEIRFGSELTDSLADELRDGVKNDIADAMDAVKWAIAHPLAQARQAAAIEGALTTLEYKRGLASNTPGVNAVIDQQIMVLRGKWSELTGIAYNKGVDAANALESGLRTFKPVNIAKPYTGTSKPLGGNDEKGKKRAGGGPVNAGEAYTVGENGEETLVMGNQGGYIIPHGGRGRGGGGGSLHVHVHLSSREFRGNSRHDRVLQGGAAGF